MKYIRRVLISFSALPVLFAIALYTYYRYNRHQHADSIPDSGMSHDVSSIYYKITDNLLFLSVLSLLPGIVMLIIINSSKAKRKDIPNRRASIIYLISIGFFILCLLGLSGNALVYFFD